MVVAAILAAVEPGFQPGGFSVETTKRSANRDRIDLQKLFSGGWKPPSTAGRDACLHIFR